jgi:hypothetical protein
MNRFIDELVSGKVTSDQFQDRFDDFVDEWHESNSDLPLHTYLGLSDDEFDVVALQPCALKYVVQARRAGLETGFPAIIDCACGKDHETVPTDTEYDDETGESFTYELVCRIHRKHEPCRPCMRERRASTPVS